MGIVKAFKPTPYKVPDYEEVKDDDITLAAKIVQLKQRAEEAEQDRDNLEYYYKGEIRAARDALTDYGRVIVKNNILIKEAKRLKTENERMEQEVKRAWKKYRALLNWKRRIVKKWAKRLEQKYKGA